MALAGAACKPLPDGRVSADAEAAARGRAIIADVKCGACHVIPGIAWPQGRTGPVLTGFGPHGLIAGALPATPANLAAFVRNAPEAKPGSTMPPMPLNRAEARDVAAYLYAMGDK